MSFEPFPTNTIVGAFLLGFPALFSIVNPIGAALVFYNLTEANTHAERIGLARRVAVYALTVLLGSILLGGYFLNFFGVSLGALRVAGGVVVVASAWPLLMGPDPTPAPATGRQPMSAAECSSKAFFPITMPITTGPGTISVAIALASVRPMGELGVVQFFAGLSLAAVANVVVVYLTYAGADRVVRLVGEGGARIVSRLAAFLLLCIGVQILATGAEALLAPWVIHTARQVG